MNMLDLLQTLEGGVLARVYDSLGEGATKEIGTHRLTKKDGLLVIVSDAPDKLLPMLVAVHNREGRMLNVGHKYNDGHVEWRLGTKRDVRPTPDLTAFDFRFKD